MKVPIPDDWDGVSWCEYGICWPDSEGWRAILRGFITTPMRGRFWDERSGNILTVQETGKQIWLDNVPLREVIMSCTTGTEIAEALREVADALRNNVCCTGGGSITITGGGTGGTGVESPPWAEIDDTDREQDPPEGFETWEEWDTNKCNAARWILDQWSADIDRAQTINFVSTLLMPALLKLLAVTILSPIPGDEIVIMAGMIILAIQQGVIDPALDAIAQALSDRDNDLLCAIYRSSNAEAAGSAVRTILSEEYEALDVATEWVANGLSSNWTNSANINRAFELNPEIDYPTEDCSECASEVPITVTADSVWPAANIGTTGELEVPITGYNVFTVTATRTDATHFRVKCSTPDVYTCVYWAYDPVDVYLPGGVVEGFNCNNDYVTPVPRTPYNLIELMLLSQIEETYTFDVCVANTVEAVNDWLATLS